MDGLGWKGIHAVVSLADLLLIVWASGLARQHPVVPQLPPLGLHHHTALFALLALVLVAAACIPRTGIKAELGHPGLAGVKISAFGHLLATACCARWCCLARSWCGRVLFIVSRRCDSGSARFIARLRRLVKYPSWTSACEHGPLLRSGCTSGKAA